ncbi:MAG: response regulator [Desulfobacteraceae bacterium]|nr:response regulator [Desulfobacteraceae bacterium]
MLYVPKILIVDDEARMRNRLKVLLGFEGYNIHTGRNGREAIECLNKDSYDIVLLDMIMPDMDGCHVMDYIKGKHLDTMLIIMTGHASVDSAVKCLKRGAYDYLRKPFDFEQLLARVKNTVDQIKLKKENEIVRGKLEVTEQRYQYLVNASPDIIYTLNPEGEITFINGAVESLLGCSAEQLVSKHYTDIILGDDLNKAKYRFNERRTGSRATSGVELRLKTSNNDYDPEKSLIIELKSMGIYDKPVDEPDKTFMGTYGVARDIGDRKRLEAQVVQSAKMASLGVMTCGITHEIRNPMAVCSSAAQLLLKKPDDRVLREECADKIYSNIHRASQIIENLLKFSRTSGEDFGSVNLNEALELTLSLITHQIKLHQIELNREFAKDLPYVMGNANLLQQVFLNLILNAYNAMPEGGKLTLSTLVNPDGEVEIRFADTGCGIPEENLEYIFDPFFTSMPVGQGTGLGLSVSYGIIERHGGSIEVESTVDVGSNFTVKLPLTRDWKNEPLNPKP